MKDCSSGDAAQRRDGTSRISTDNVLWPPSHSSLCRMEGRADSLVRLHSYLCASCKKTVVAAAFPAESGFAY